MPTRAYRQSLALFRVTREETVRMVDPLSQERMDFRPAANQWSAGEIVDHLLLSESGYREMFGRLIRKAVAGERPVIQAEFADFDARFAGVPRPVMELLSAPLTLVNLFVPPVAREWLVRFPVAPAKNPAAATPRPGRPAADLVRELRESYAATEALFETHPDLDYRAMRFSHPVFGNNHAVNLLRILAMHEKRHQGQMAGLLRLGY